MTNTENINSLDNDLKHTISAELYADFNIVNAISFYSKLRHEIIHDPHNELKNELSIQLRRELIDL